MYANHVRFSSVVYIGWGCFKRKGEPSHHGKIHRATEVERVESWGVHFCLLLSLIHTKAQNSHYISLCGISF